MGLFSSKPAPEKNEKRESSKDKEQDQVKEEKKEPEVLPPIEVELLILGDAGIGKSVWRHKFLDDSIGFGDPKYGEGDKEKDVMVQEYRCKGRDLLLNLRDTQGEEKDDGEVSEKKLEGLHGVFLMYDVTNPDSLKSIDSWLEKTHKVSPNAKAVLIGNKFEEKKRTVTFQEGQEVAERLNMPFFETSGRAGIMVDQAIRSMVLTLAEEYEKQQEAA
eukprot:CAMPEP_0201509900 /NCGR_PEP_ID=MMETSP0161_2-20130828/2815_1 /ASSEMBLY_ACC=CAM_ASM_000251 /TAXON_ID=180227 /ORGANISM="Neoparamoeba aestuarina, Strain SoJaBio B1-5/56/2" /LENGTH=216 /DNA_ID=CAMNT_0047904991 /DNA_START=1053 /DNA_END=1703 /DNA_ORIENTATION=-